MAIDRERKIARRHAAAVVGDGDPPPSAAVGEDVDPAGAGVDRVLHQLLDHARGPFDHFAGGDAIDDLLGELADGHDGSKVDSICSVHFRWCGDKCIRRSRKSVSGWGRGRTIILKILMFEAAMALAVRPAWFRATWDCEVAGAGISFRKLIISPEERHVPPFRAPASTRL